MLVGLRLNNIYSYTVFISSNKQVQETKAMSLFEDGHCACCEVWEGRV